VGLHHRCIVVNIHDKAGEEVTLAMHEAEAIVVLSDKTKRLAQVPRIYKACAKEVVRESLHTKFEHTHRDATYLIMAYAHGLTLVIFHHYEVALFQIGGQLRYRSGEYPWMTAL
jgi:hypothetical protein